MAGVVGLMRRLGGKSSYNFGGSLLAGSSTPTCNQVLSLTGGRGFKPSTTIFATAASRQVHATEAAAVAAQPDAVNVDASANNKTPKRPPNAYALYFKESYDAYKAKHPDLKFADMSRALSSQWKSLSPPEKERFVTAADKAARSFVPPPAAAKTGKKAAAKKVDGPKRPVPAYARFVKENYSLVKGRNPDKKNPEIFAELAKEYKALSPADKAKFKS